MDDLLENEATLCESLEKVDTSFFER